MNSSLQAVIFRVAKGPFVEEFYQCVTYGFYTAPWQEQLYTSFSLLFMFLIPLCILIATYTTTFATIAMPKTTSDTKLIFARCLGKRLFYSITVDILAT
ncbi:uncharacterized protein CEXT_815691 [Caerostris extrusa]|uniref:Uncharacterized protein n=1 Tax=Caerostris extrusa TaxID=172846 RepID=A0AAV4U882_CAEEX|nr:uncharacterized protein CEXT_815691 [Caerostris extrusa]